MSDRIYIEVEVIFYPDGRLVPKSFVWECEKIGIDQASGPTIQLGSGIKYICQAQGRQYVLHFDINRWYVIKD